MRELCIIVVLFSAVAMSAEAGPILDQSYQPSEDNGYIVELTQSLAQSFTVGIVGTLVRFDVELARVDDPIPSLGVDWELRELDGVGLPKGALLASGTLAPGDIAATYSFIPVDLTSFAVRVSEGDEYAIVLSSLSDYTRPGGGINPYAWRWGGDGYARGEPFFKRPPFDWGSIGPDMGFKTFVQPVPEPSALVLLGLAAGAVTSRRHRRLANARISA